MFVGDYMDSFKFKKKFGQNFIKDSSITNKMCYLSNIQKDSLIIEVGPGMGVLTDVLKDYGEVLSYEIDTTLKDTLLDKFKDNNNVSFIFDDFMERDINDDIRNYNYKHLYFISNVPYYITTPILMKIMKDLPNIDSIVMMVQKEVAIRYSSKPGSKSYSSISVYLNYFFDSHIIMNVSRKCFMPEPNVDSSVIMFTKKNNRKIAINEEVFFKLVRDSFQFKRKTLRNNLKSYDLDKVSLALSKYNYDLSIRAEELPLDVFIEISDSLS